MITRKAKYALKALIYLADRFGKNPVLVQDISEKENIPKKFLESILLQLKNGGLVQSRKGKGGGYMLLLSPSEISLATILRQVDGPIAPLPCASLNFYKPCLDCEDEVACRLRHTLIAVRNANLTLMEQVSLAEMCQRSFDFPYPNNVSSRY